MASISDFTALQLAAAGGLPRSRGGDSAGAQARWPAYGPGSGAPTWAFRSTPSGITSRNSRPKAVVGYRREQRGVGAPTFAYHLTPAGEASFPSATRNSSPRCWIGSPPRRAARPWCPRWKPASPTWPQKLQAELADASPVPPPRSGAAGAGRRAGSWRNGPKDAAGTSLTEHNCAIRARGRAVSRDLRGGSEVPARSAAAAVEREAHMLSGCTRLRIQVRFPETGEPHRRSPGTGVARSCMSSPVEQPGQPGIQVRLRHRHRGRHHPARAERGRRPADLRQEERAALHARVAAQGLSALAGDEGAASLGQHHLPGDRLPGHHLLLGAQDQKPLGSLDEVDPELLKTYEKLGIPLSEQKRLAGVAVDAIFDSVSVAHHLQGHAGQGGLIFCSFSEAVREHPELVQKYLGSVVPYNDNFFAALNSAVFSDGSFVYVPKGVRCPMELSTYFRINTADAGQFERTLIVADEGASVSYLEGCTAPKRDTNQLHAAVVELVALEGATIKYSTVQNWYAGDEEGKGGIYNFVTKRGKAAAATRKISWTQVETGSAITWKYPSVILQGDNSVGEFYSVAVVNGRQQADTGTKMIHIGKNTRSTIVSKGISAGQGNNSYRGPVKVLPKAEGARNYTQCDSMLIGNRCGAHTFPYIDVQNPTASVEHEATTSKIGEDQIFYCKQRGLNTENAISMIVNGFCKEVFKELPMEFAVEAQKLLGVSLEGSVG